jgi:hypothetical protein
MPLSFCKFAWVVAKSAGSSATKTKAGVRCVLGWLFAIAVYIGLVPQEVLTMTWIAWIAPTVFTLAFLVFIFYHAYCVYWKAETEREKVAKELEDFRLPKVRIIGPIEIVSLSAGNVCFAYRIRVKNISGVTIPNCRLRLLSSVPQITDAPSTLLQNAKNLAPDDEEVFVICERKGAQLLFKSSSQRTIPAAYEKQTYALSLLIIGDNTTSLPFAVNIDPVANPPVFIQFPENG